jgi:hypothetical protein
VSVIARFAPKDKVELASEVTAPEVVVKLAVGVNVEFPLKVMSPEPVFAKLTVNACGYTWAALSMKWAAFPVIPTASVIVMLVKSPDVMVAVDVPAPATPTPPPPTVPPARDAVMLVPSVLNVMASF